MQPRPKLGAKTIKRYTEDSQLYIDFDWWEQSDLDLKTYLSSRLNIAADILLDPETDQVDLIDPRTAEVRRVDGFQYVLQSYFRQLPDDFIKRASLVDAVFCVLLGNANHPMRISELADRVQRPPDIILRTLAGRKVYQGIRPVIDDN